MTKKQKAEMYFQIKRHGENLLNLFPNAAIKDPILLCKALHRLELKAHKAAENWCNGVEAPAAWNSDNGDFWAEQGYIIAAKAAKLLGMSAAPACGLIVVFNGDARGYALKLTNGGNFRGQPVTVDIYRDMGGYGIIAPDFFPVEKAE